MRTERMMERERGWGRERRGRQIGGDREIEDEERERGGIEIKRERAGEREREI